MKIKLLLMLCALLPHWLYAEVLRSDHYGFEVQHEVVVATDAATAYQQFLRVDQWWHPEHTWFGDAANLSIEAHAGGCFCELSGERQVMHMQVVYVEPDKLIRFRGGLGPLQDLGVQGAMTWRFQVQPDGKTKIVHHYQAIGFIAQGMDSLAPIVDKVQNIQIQRLAARLSGTGEVK